MTTIVFKPEKDHIVNGRGLYRGYLNKKPMGLMFRAKTTLEADAMFQYLLMTQTQGKTLFVDPAFFTEGDKDEEHDDRERGSAETPGGDNPAGTPAS